METLARRQLGDPRAPATPLGEAVVKAIVTSIVTGKVAPGERLPTEVELCSHFGVSRTVIRESMKRLDEKGLIRSLQGSGTVVTDPQTWNVLDRVVLSTMIEHDAELGILDELAVVRAQLESEMAARVAREHAPDQLAHLRELHTALADAADDAATFAQADLDFHWAIMRISGERLSGGIASTLMRRARDSARFRGAPGPDAPALTMAEHEAVLEAIAAGRPERAAVCMREHIELAWQRRRLPLD